MAGDTFRQPTGDVTRKAYSGVTTKDGPGTRAANSDRALPPRHRRFHMSTPRACDSPRDAA